jgi:hypothetical protein
VWFEDVERIHRKPERLAAFIRQAEIPLRFRCSFR